MREVYCFSCKVTKRGNHHRCGCGKLICDDCIERYGMCAECHREETGIAPIERGIEELKDIIMSLVDEVKEIKRELNDINRSNNNETNDYDDYSYDKYHHHSPTLRKKLMEIDNIMNGIGGRKDGDI